MRAEARALAQVLLDHHRAKVALHPPKPGRIIPSRYTIRYGDLCSKAGAPHLTRIVGNFLQDVAEWCDASGFPPLNSLAVNETGMPGDGYDGAGGFIIVNWPSDVEACVRFTAYPASPP